MPCSKLYARLAKKKGGLNIYEVILFIFLILIVYICTEEYLKFKKSRRIFSKSYLNFNQKSFKYLNKYLIKIEERLFKLGYPYRITTKKYFFIKYVLSQIVLVVSFINYSNKILAIVIWAVSFFYLDYMIYSFKKSENIIIINELKNLINSIVICLSAYTTLKEALEVSVSALGYKRLQRELKIFIRSYEAYGYDIEKASKVLDGKFDSYELDMFIGILKQSEKDGNVLENLEKFSEILELSYFKYIKRQSARRLINVTLGTVLILLDIALIVMYPIFVQVIQNLQNIFI